MSNCQSDQIDSLTLLDSGCCTVMVFVLAHDSVLTGFVIVESKDSDGLFTESSHFEPVASTHPLSGVWDWWQTGKVEFGCFLGVFLEGVEN